MEEKSKSLDESLDELAKTLHTQSEIIIDVLLRITALERMIFEKGVCTEEDFKEQLLKAKDQFLDYVKTALQTKN